MKEVFVTYEHDPAQTGIKVVVSASEKDEQISELIDLIQDPCQRMWAVRTEEGGAITIPEEDIITISANSKKLKVVSDGGTYTLKMTLKDAEAHLNSNTFMRISRYDIINLRKVRHFDFSIAGMLGVELSDGEMLWASRRFIPAIKQRLSKKKRR